MGKAGLKSFASRLYSHLEHCSDNLKILKIIRQKGERLRQTIPAIAYILLMDVSAQARRIVDT